MKRVLSYPDETMDMGYDLRAAAEKLTKDDGFPVWILRRPS